MSTVNFKNLFILFVVCGASSACTENSPESVKTNRVEQSGFSYHGAGQRNLGLKFILKGDSVRTITAVVVLPEYLDFKDHTLKYRWQLDEDIKILEGESTGSIVIKPNQKHIEFKLTVNNFSTDLKRFIRFEASSDVNAGIKKNRFFIDGIVSSQSESSFENFVKGIENYKKKVHYDDEK